MANEVIRNRSQVLAENLTKWGHPDVIVTNSYPKDFARLPDFFDLLVTDVPCSGEGMFRKEEDAVTGWSMELCGCAKIVSVRFCVTYGLVEAGRAIGIQYLYAECFGG